MNQMSNYDANPVGLLYERYQSSGVSPLYNVTQKTGQAHAPIFEAILTVPGGMKVISTGSSKKIAKNTAAKMMLDHLEGREYRETSTARLEEPGQQNNETNNNREVVLEGAGPRSCGPGLPGAPSLQSQPAVAASVADFYAGLQRSSGPELERLHTGQTCLAAETTDFVTCLESLAAEQGFTIKFLSLESLEGVEQSLVQIFCGGGGGAGPACPGRVITVCLGMGPASKSEAARCALTYIRTMSRPAHQQ